jgi:hypothetical protein
MILFLNVVGVISQSGTGASAIIAATMPSSAMGSRLQQPIVSVIVFGHTGIFFSPTSAVDCVINVQTLDVATIPTQCSPTVLQLGIVLATP